MATVPGDPSPPSQPTMPKEFEPSIGHFLQAAAIMDGMGRFQTASNVLPIRSQKSLQKAIEDAEGDEDLNKIKARLEKRGMMIPSQLGHGVLSPTGEDK